MRDDDTLLSTPGLEFGSGVIGICDICHTRQAVIVLQKERFQLCVTDFLNKTFVNSKATPGRPTPPYRSERVWYLTDATSTGKAPAVVLTPTKLSKHPTVLITPDIYGLTTTTLDAAIRFAREGFEVLLPDVGKTSGVGPADHLSLRAGGLFGGAVTVTGSRVQHLVRLYADGLRYLRGREMVDPARTGVFGSSYGGSLAVALAGADRQLSALALAYPIPVRPVDFMKLVTAPILVVRGSGDRRAAAAVRQLEAAAGRQEITLETAEFPGVGHQFLARDLRAYDLAQAEAAWTRVLAFFRARLLPAPPKPPVKPAAAPAPAVPPAAPASPAPAPAPTPVPGTPA